MLANGYGTGPSFPDPSTSHLFTVNLGSGVATNIGPSGVTAGRSLKYSGLAFRDDGTLLSMGSLDGASGALYSVSTETGAPTSLSGTGLPYGTGPIKFGVDGGLAFAPAPDTRHSGRTRTRGKRFLRDICPFVLDRRLPQNLARTLQLLFLVCIVC